MNGPEHYLEAEKLLRSCRLCPELDHPDDAATYPAREDGIDAVGNALAAAQVHATLALAAAQAAVVMETYLELDDTATAWAQALA